MQSTGISLIERRNAFEFMRNQDAEQFDAHLRMPWRPRLGSMVNREALTAAMIDSRDFVRRASVPNARCYYPKGRRWR